MNNNDINIFDGDRDLNGGWGNYYASAALGIKVGDLIAYSQKLRRVEAVGAVDEDGDTDIAVSKQFVRDEFASHQVRREGEAFFFATDGIAADGDWVRCAGFAGRIQVEGFVFVKAGDKVEFNMVDKTEEEAARDKRERKELADDEAAE